MVAGRTRCQYVLGRSRQRNDVEAIVGHGKISPLCQLLLLASACYAAFMTPRYAEYAMILVYRHARRH